MGTTFKYAPGRWSTEDGNSSPGGKRPTDSVAAEDIFDDPNILSELNEANASLAARHDSAPQRFVPARLPPVDAFDLDEACRTSDSEEAHRAKSLAHRLGPPSHDPSPKRSRWRFNKARKPQEDPGDTEWPTPPYSKAPRASRRAFFWGFCTSLAIVVAAPVVFGIVGPPRDESAPAPLGDIRNDNGRAGIGLAAQSAPATGTAATDRSSNETVVIRNQPAAAAIVAPATTAFAAPLVRPPAPAGGSAIGERPDVGEQTELSAPAPSPVPVTDSDNPSPAPQPIDTRAELPEPAPEPEPATLPDDGDFTQMAQSQLSARTDPAQMEVVEEPVVGERLPVAETEQPASSSLSLEQIDQLLARGEELLRSGDIASARLLFLHVAAAGDRRGAKAVGMTYDPKVFARLPVMGITPDLEQAQLWYGKAGGDLSYTIDLASPAGAVSAAESTEGAELEQWNAACARKYKSFEPSTGLYTAISGAKRRCQLP